MTAINCLTWPDQAFVFTDAAANIGGAINWIGNKVRLFPNFPAVLTVTGTGFGSLAADQYIGGASVSFDDMVSTMGASILRAALDYPEAAQGYAEESQGGECDFLAVGWSDRANGFAAYQCSYVPGSEPLTLPCGRLYLQPGAPDIIRALRSKGMDPDAFATLSPEAAVNQMTETMQIQRDNAPPGCVIGGYQQITVLTRGGIFTRVAQIWPDRVTYCPGEPTGLLPGLVG